MKTITQSMLNLFKEEVYRPITMVRISVVELLGFTDYEHSVNYDGHLWQPRGMRLGNISSGNTSIADSFKIEIDDVDRSIYKDISELGFEASKAIGVELYLAILDDSFSFSPINVAKLYSGTVDSWVYRPGSVELTVVSILSQWSNVTTSQFSASCRWKSFGSAPPCGYNGSSTYCDRTYEQCKAFNNLNNFGGFRWLPYISGRTLRLGNINDKSKRI